jgi:hypothetical protein
MEQQGRLVKEGYALSDKKYSLKQEEKFCI